MDALLFAAKSAIDVSIVTAAVIGLIVGIVGGALPGISASITLALVLPFSYGLEPVVAIVLLGADIGGAEYGGSIPAILIRTPGTGGAAATVVDGYEMNKRGRGDEALGLSLMSGVIGGLVGLLALVLMAEPLADLALYFTPMAFFALGILGMSVIASLSDGAMLKGFAAAVVGLMIATIGTDPVSGVQRLTFDSSDLVGGIKPILIMIGVFAVSEMMYQCRAPAWSTMVASLRTKLPNLAMLWRCRIALALGSAIGIFEGLTPGGGASIASWLSYNEAKRWSKNPEEFGKGSPEGVAAPEAANNTVACAALIPTLSLGIPSSNSTAVLLGGLLLHGMVPGPLLFEKSADFVYGLYGGLLTANLLQIPIGMLILVPCMWLVNRPKPWLIAGVMALVFSGVYTIDESYLHLAIVLVAGLAGYLMRWLGVPVLPLIMGLVLGYMVESNYRRALLLSDGNHATFVTDPLSLTFLLLAAAIAVAFGWRALKKGA
jgi:putative tricarboxylic transport membrane protein